MGRTLTVTPCYNGPTRPFGSFAMSSDSAGAAIVYDLADKLVRLRYFAESKWCSDELDETLPEGVDVLVGSALQLVGDLGELGDLVPGDDRLTPQRNALAQSMNDAWNQFKDAWQSQQHRALIREKEKLGDPESDYDDDTGMIL